jgi:hypothetical protein
LSEKKDDLQNNDKKETEDQKKEQTISNGTKQDEGASNKNNTDNPNNVSTSMDEIAVMFKTVSYRIFCVNQKIAECYKICYK